MLQSADRIDSTGAAIAQCLSAAMRTVPSNFLIHSMHCYFVLNGNADIPIVYHVEHVREGRSFATRTVQARQRGKPIFTTTMSFMREGAGGADLVEHEVKMPYVPGPTEGEETRLPQGEEGPFESQRIDILNNNTPHPETKKTRQWIRARGRISDKGGHQAHLSALAYMSDSYFIGTVARVHKLWRMTNPGRARDRASGKPGIDEDVVKKLLEENDDETLLKKFPGLKAEEIQDVRQNGASALDKQTRHVQKRPEVGMMVSLDHTIYFHNPRGFRADEWIFTEMESPWAGDGRGLVFQKMYTREGKLIATCVQEVSARLSQHAVGSRILILLTFVTGRGQIEAGEGIETMR